MLFSFSFTFYGYLNPESTKTRYKLPRLRFLFYGYLNPESTKTGAPVITYKGRFTVT